MLFSIYDRVSKEVKEGTVYTLASCCKADKSSCHRYYCTQTKSGLFECPHGFTTEIFDHTQIIIGIGVEGYCDRQKMKKNGYSGRILSLPEYQYLVDQIKRENDLQKKLDSNEMMVHDLFHDIRKLNQGIKNSCDGSLDQLEQDSLTRKPILNILDSSNIITFRLDYYSYIVNPESIGTLRNVKIYRIFERITQMFNSEAHQKSVNINLGNCWKIAQMYRIMDIVPYIIIENAMKYAPSNSAIDITFREDADHCIATITSLGPPLGIDEEQLIFERGYRGKHAESVGSISGSGLGLSIVKSICDIHGYRVIASSHQQKNSRYDQRKYNSFSVMIDFSNVFDDPINTD